MIKSDNITAGMARSFEIQDERFQQMQHLLLLEPLRNTASSLLRYFGHAGLEDRLKLVPIVSVFIPPECMIVVPRFKHYIWLSYDYAPDCTTHFKELISKN